MPLPARRRRSAARPRSAATFRADSAAERRRPRSTAGSRVLRRGCARLSYSSASGRGRRSATSAGEVRPARPRGRAPRAARGDRGPAPGRRRAAQIAAASAGSAPASASPASSRRRCVPALRCRKSAGSPTRRHAWRWERPRSRSARDAARDPERDAIGARQLAVRPEAETLADRLRQDRDRRARQRPVQKPGRIGAARPDSMMPTNSFTIGCGSKRGQARLEHREKSAGERGGCLTPYSCASNCALAVEAPFVLPRTPAARSGRTR